MIELLGMRIHSIHGPHATDTYLTFIILFCEIAIENTINIPKEGQTIFRIVFF